jgi:antitoxin component YwqK of YwqJK toxin-antitoxin module
MATVNKNFRIKNGLVVEGSTGTINGQNILTETGSDQYILDLVGGANLIDSVASGLSITDSVLSIDRTVVDGWYDANGAAATAQSNAEDYADGLASNYDAAGSASTAESNAKSYADGLASNYDAAGSASTAESNAKSYADGLASNYDAAGSASTAESNAKSYADGLASNYDAAGAASQALTDANDYTDTAVSNLVGTAPAVLDTLQELAAAIGNDVNLVDGIGVAIGNKLPKAGGTMSGDIAMGSNKITGLGSPSSNNDAATKKYVDDAQTSAQSYADGLASNYDAAGSASTAESNAKSYADGLASNYDPAGAASTAESNAKSYADGLASNYDAAGAASQALTDANDYTDGYVGAVLDGSEPFTAINVNSVSLQKAVQSLIATAQNGSSMLSWAKSNYGSAKAWVKFATATHSQISEILLTTDSSNNIAITDFAEVGTNGSLGTITASYLAGNIAIEVNTVYANTTVTVVATLIK